jgi:hypothetical protein
MPKKNSSPSVNLLDVQDTFNAAVCRVKALAHGIRSIYESGADDDIGAGFDYLFQDTIIILDGIETSLDQIESGNTSVPAKIVNLS